METFNSFGIQVYVFRPLSKSQDYGIFSHANGIASMSYVSFLTNLSIQKNMIILAFDTIGFGQSSKETDSIYEMFGAKNLGEGLAERQVQLCSDLMFKYPNASTWTMIGHSIGAWLSIVTASKLNIQNVIAIEPPMLSFKQSLKINIAKIVGQRRKQINSQSKSRSTVYTSHQHIAKIYRRSAFFKSWDPQCILDYAVANFHFDSASNKMLLNHDPIWEADLVKSQPLSMTAILIKLPNRKNINVQIFIGKNSDLSKGIRNNYFRFIFKNAMVHCIEDAGHMLPFEQEYKLILALCGDKGIQFEKDKSVTTQRTAI